MLCGDARYADVFERSLYNGVLAGAIVRWNASSTSTRSRASGRIIRSVVWLRCPPTWRERCVALGGYAYAVSDDALWVNLYIQGSATAKVQGEKVTLEVKTDYPWDGKVLLNRNCRTRRDSRCVCACPDGLTAPLFPSTGREV